MHMYDPLKRGGRLCDRLLPNRSITFRPNDNDIIGPFICGVIQRGLKSIMRFPCNCIFEWFMPCSLIIHYSGTTAKRGEMNKSGEKKQQKKTNKARNVFSGVHAAATGKKKKKKMKCYAELLSALWLFQIIWGKNCLCLWWKTSFQRIFCFIWEYELWCVKTTPS